MITSLQEQKMDSIDLVQILTYPIKITINHDENEADSLMWLATDPSACVIFVPGNPGVIDYYECFLSELYSKLEKKYHVIGISHLGHSKYQKKLFDLDDQINFHSSCIKKLGKAFRVPVYLISHSIGCYIIQKVLENNASIDFKKNIFLFPAIHKIKETKKGAWMSKNVFAMPYRFIIIQIVRILGLLPTILLLFVLTKLFKTQEKYAQATINKLIHIFENVVYMAVDEMNKVGEINYSFYDGIIDKSVIYFGAYDGWVLEDFPLEIKRRYEKKDNIIFCSKNIPHVFVTEHSKIMADIVSAWIY